MPFKVDERPQESRKLFKSKYSVDTQHDCDSGSDFEWENGDETDFQRNAFDALDDEQDL